MILPPERLLEAGSLPLDINVLQNKITQICNEVRLKLEIRWLKDIADIFLKYRNVWRHLIPRTVTESQENVEKLFRCVHSIMSRQIRDLVERSLRNFRDFLLQYEVCILT